MKNAFDLIHKGVMLVAGNDLYTMNTRLLFSWTVQIGSVREKNKLR